jgi:hypothetical protein
MQGYLSIGTAGDFLGYLIYPLASYPEPIRRALLSGDPPPVGDPACKVLGVSIGCPDPIGNDNFFFNVSETMGMRVMCSQLRGAAVTLGKPQSTYLSKQPECALVSNDLLNAPGADTKFPPEPDLSKQQPHM